MNPLWWDWTRSPLKENWRNVEAEDQSAVAKTCWVVIPAIDAAVAAAPLIEWAKNIEVSTPAEVKIDFNQRAIVDETTGECGFC